MASASTPGARSRQTQESQPLSSNVVDKPPLQRDSSVIQQVSHFIGLPTAAGQSEEEIVEEKAKWDAKRLRRIANRYSLNENEVVQRFARNRSINQGGGGAPSEVATTPSETPDDVERGFSTTAARVSRRLGPTPSLPNYESTSSSFDAAKLRTDSFHTVADMSQGRLPKHPKVQRESVPAAVLNSVTTFFKKGSLVNKNRYKLRNSLASKCSFDMDVSSTLDSSTDAFPMTTTPSSTAEDVPKTSDESPVGIVFKTASGEQHIEMKEFGAKRKKKDDKITEETSFEVEMAEMDDEDEAQDGEMASSTSDPSAISRMTAKVRKKSSVRIPPIVAREPDELSHLTTRSAPAPAPRALLQRGKTVAPPERPSDLREGTRPYMHPSTSLPSRATSTQRKKSRQAAEDARVLELLAEESEKKDREEGELDDEDGGSSTTAPGTSYKARFRKPGHMLIDRSISLVDEVFFDSPDARLLVLQTGVGGGPAGMPAPELDAYHPDIAQSPPTSAKLAASFPYSSYPFEPARITVAREEDQRADQTDFPGSVRYHQEGNITFIDLGDSTLNRPRATVLGTVGPIGSTRPDRPAAELESAPSTTRRGLVRQLTIEDVLPEEVRVRHQRKNRETHAMALKVAESRTMRRQRGIGVFGKFFKLSYKDDLSSEVAVLLSEGEDERAWFTYWVTSIQIFVCIASILVYGIGPFGTGTRDHKDDVMDTTLSIRRVSYMEPENMWIGPHYADLIRLGAVYSPCMRREPGLWEVIEEERRIENRTGCCIANDHSGCYQSSELHCPRNVARWVRWDKPSVAISSTNKKPPLKKSKSDSDLLSRSHSHSHQSNTSVELFEASFWKQQRRSGAVCGQDPSYCDSPLSVAPHEWPDDITLWPICEKKHEGVALPEHVTCQVTGRPCCIQLQGLCRIATKQYCDFVAGHWHENATLCSQVNCFAGVCGMLPFFFGTYPDQFYRLFVSLFIHAGLIHLAATIAFQWWAMRDLERLIGSKRMAILYVLSGVGGNLASAIFVPYNPEVGPSGSQCGILAAIFVDFYYHRHFIAKYWEALFEHVMITVIVIAAGLVPWIDNWAHLFGFAIGLLTTIITFPYLDFPSEDAPPVPDGPSIIATAPPPPVTPLASSPLPRGSPSTIMSTADTPMAMAAGYSQLANGFPSPETPGRGGGPWISVLNPVQSVWRSVQKRFSNKRSLYVLVAAVVLLLLLLVLFATFFANFQIDCPLCIYFNCVPPFLCHNQGQKLKKWLPI